jgi:gas vesicle protein
MAIARFFAGALVGVAAGLLLAPKKGEELRNDIAENASRLRDRFTRIADTSSTELEDLRCMLQSEIGGLSDDVRHRLLDLLDEAELNEYTARATVASELR